MIDEIDAKILEVLSKNSRTPYVKIARETGLSDVAVIKRVRKLRSSGVIKKFSISVDPQKLGYTKISLTGINVDPDSILRVIESVKSRGYVKFLAITSGDHELLALVWARDAEELAKIHRELESIPGVKRVYPSIVLDVVKEELALI